MSFLSGNLRFTFASVIRRDYENRVWVSSIRPRMGLTLRKPMKINPGKPIGLSVGGIALFQAP